MNYSKVKEKADKIDADLTKERDERCEPIAKAVLKAVSDFNGPALSNDRLAFVKAYDPLIMQILEILREADVPIEEWGYIMQIAQVPLDHVKNYVGETISKNITEAMNHYWGKDEGKITLTDLVLKKASMLQSK